MTVLSETMERYNFHNSVLQVCLQTNSDFIPNTKEKREKKKKTDRAPFDNLYSNKKNKEEKRTEIIYPF